MKKGFLGYKQVLMFVALVAMFGLSDVVSTQRVSADEAPIGFVQNDNGARNYIKDGKKALYWHQLDGKWYYFGEDGNLVVGWQYIPTKYHIGVFEGDSIVEIGIFPKWFYFSAEGVLAEPGWQYLPIKDAVNTNKIYGQTVSDTGLGKQWYYLDKESSPVVGWLQKGDDWFLLSDEESHYGEMLTGWQGDYYLKENGYMAHNEWLYDDDYHSWFHLNADGKYAANQWVNGYYLKDWGYMAKAEWIFDKNYDSWYYLTEDGHYASNQWVGSYYLKDYGKMAHNEWIFDSHYDAWYYLHEDGTYAHNEWIGNYYLTSDGSWDAKG
ncbi:Glucan-binding domain-containing protein (YG repeat) [Granulicatella balaenopterae]|uniref:Glucan-binding domain-containing protein (YG repeat) n=1 Tax=Granulicatella balaenopterae TaxID=137733 RepID=A0A1H9HGB4_9LACT|nr:hypothetical protein [Granulicatella balaenopterae]SEQ61328.1 Glucan-binding domain-containing protein (YG repeat) [Granulicatella balaenopterae]